MVMIVAIPAIIIIVPHAPEVKIDYYRRVPVTVIERIISPIISVPIINRPIVIISYTETSTINANTPGKRLVIVPV
jgi:hypothetical protein